MRNFAYAKTKAYISFTINVKLIFAVTAKLISAFVFATQIVQFLFFLNPKFTASCIFCARFVSDLLGNHIHGWFSHDAAQLIRHKMSLKID